MDCLEKAPRGLATVTIEPFGDLERSYNFKGLGMRQRIALASSFGRTPQR